MRLVPSFLPKQIATLLVAATFAAPILIAGCAAHVRVYDPYYHDYHAWNGEVVYYNQWERDTHREHLDYSKRSAAEQQQYWNWRHSQDHDHH